MGRSFREQVSEEAHTSDTINDHIMNLIDLVREYTLGCSNLNWNRNKKDVSYQLEDAEKDLDEYFDFWNPLAFGQYKKLNYRATRNLVHLELASVRYEKIPTNEENVIRLINDRWILIDFEEVAKIGELRLALNIAAPEYMDGEDLC
ncbi:11734_t:CDS:2 [Funneliformis geosporum]|uniref:11734_t:CDS:1 n=1 Tax=Funneliformis geosporum TaxID=1117311 RepID=A0A9W4SJD9_9GLOM|nr:11734_t:CDS:2 [Funneliformis geosporum]